MNRQQASRFVRFVWRESRPRLLLIGGLTITLGLFLIWQSVDWWTKVEPVLSILTLGVALLVSYQQMREEWEEDFLPKRLTAHFYFEGTEVMRCENAHLAGEADIRALTQQIGFQMNNVTQLAFAAPDVQVTGPIISHDGSCVQYVARVELFEWPTGIPNNVRRIWREPFVTDGKPTFIEEVLQAPV